MKWHAPTTITLLALALGGASAATWSKPAQPIASAVVGVGAASSKVAYTAAGDNGAGAECLKTTDGGATFTADTIGQAFLLLDASASKTNTKSAVINGLFGAQYTTDGVTFKGALGGGGEGQSVESFGKNSFGIAGAFGSSGSGVAVSTDGGKSFKGFGIPTDVLDSSHPARYAAFPSDTTWYVSAGAWPTQPSNVGSDAESLLIKHLNERIQIRQRRSDGGLFYRYLELDEIKSAAPNNITEYSAAIAKTTDGGKTFTRVFQEDGSFYFNGIHCATEQHCIAVAEGHNVANPGSHIFVTKDGGNTWNQTKFNAGTGATLMGARMTSETEGWAAGGLGSNFKFEGAFFHTTDGGYTWTNEGLDGFLAMGIDCSDASNCYAPGITLSRQGTLASYH